MEHTYKKILKSSLYTSFILLYLISLFMDNYYLTYLLGCTALVIIPVSFKGASRTFQIISTIFVFAGILIFSFSGENWLTLPLHFTSTALLLSLLYFLPFINNLMVVGKYDEELQNLLQLRTKHLGQLYYRSSLIAYILCLFVFFSAITIVQGVVKDSAQKLSKSRLDPFSSQSILRSFALANVWSPIEIFIALTVTITGVAYFELLPWALFFSISLLLIDWCIGWFTYRQKIYEAPETSSETSGSQLMGKVSYLLGMLFLFIFLAFGVQKLLSITYFNAVILLILPFTLLWALTIKQLKEFISYNKKTWVPQVNGLQNLMLLFISLGFFSEMFEQTTMINMIQTPLLQLSSLPLLLFIAIQLVSLLFSLIGIHPLVTISLMGTLIQPLLTELNPLSLAIVLLTSTLASDAAGTFNTTVTIMSQLTGRNPYRITKWNIGFAIWFGTAGSLLGWMLL
ncbi:hypothetical protein CEH05_04405 [Halobacillus halophilus]|uniref:Uncharacterized protein n=2 Tax=Halobacillus halophilus TaxID=1570 RepID=I0JJC3_HALH3|nr:hypothetical protein CEH05_04405 [Halobacillus halophilus]CCG44241.1 hypothetical protein HBHAL_1879 [Halobacillus halophilus DSM 2266]